MSHYKSNLRDLFFNLFEVNDLDAYLAQPPWESIDPDTARHVLREIDRYARDEFATSFTSADRDPPTLEDDGVHLPEDLKATLQGFHAAEWHRFGLPDAIGGTFAPPSLRWALQELLVGANPSAYLFLSGGLMSSVIGGLGTPEQVERFAKPMVERGWGGTMVLTEPDAGSDVGAGTSRAIPVEGDTYHIEGVKRFITSGDADVFENIIHLVLARPEGAVPGTKGLSMFIVPKYLVNDDGTLGERNGVFATNLEKKMGIKASATCELTFGADRPAIGYLVGGVHDGIAQMFHVIEYARMLIGAKAMATLSSGYLHALEFARERIQGPDLTQARDKTAPRVTIIHHPDVRRMLMTQKAHAEGLRALLLYTGWVQDQVELHPGERHWAKLDDLLLPMVKGYSSEKAYELLGQSIQVLGGSGYLQDYPLEQYVRDAKIDTLYEGTTGIQAMDLFFRKVAKDRGEMVLHLAGEIAETVKGGEGDDSLAVERAALGTALEHVQTHLGVMGGHLMSAATEVTEVYKVGLLTNYVLESLSEVVIGWLLIRHAEVALAKLGDASGDDRHFYEGKVASARFWARHVLPKVEMRRGIAEAEDGHLMELPEEAF